MIGMPVSPPRQSPDGPFRFRHRRFRKTPPGYPSIPSQIHPGRLKGPDWRSHSIPGLHSAESGPGPVLQYIPSAMALNSFMDFIGVSSSLLFLYRPEFMGQDFVTLFIDPEFFNHQFHGHADMQFIEIASRKQGLDPYVRQIDPAVSVGGLPRKNFAGCCMMTLKLWIFPWRSSFTSFRPRWPQRMHTPLSFGEEHLSAGGTLASDQLRLLIRRGWGGPQSLPDWYGFLNISHLL